jgi:hypothetical protein
VAAPNDFNTLTRSSADAVLKEFYLPGIRSILNFEVFLLSQVETNSEDIEGRRAVLSINTGRNSGIGARAELGTLPDAGHQGYSEERVQLKYNYGRIQLSGPVIRSMGSDRGSFTRAITSETQGVTRDLRNDINRQLFGDGGGGIVALTAAASSTSFTVDAAATDTQKRQVYVGMIVDIGTAGMAVAANPGLGIGNRVVTYNQSTGAGTFASAVTVNANNFLFRSGSAGVAGSASQKELTGLAAQIASSGALWNIDPANVPDWASYVDTNATDRAPTESMFMKAAQEVNVRCGEELNLWVTSAGVQRAYANLLQSMRRFNTPTELSGGFKGLDMSNTNQGNTGTNTVSMYWDKDCPTKTAFGLTTRRFQWYKMSDWEFMEEDGAVLSRVPNTDAYEGTLFLYSELATDGRNAHAKIDKITES